MVCPYLNSEINGSEIKNELTTELYNGTRKKHKEAENTVFMKKFTAGKINKTQYIKYLFNMYLIYNKLEEQLENNKKNYIVKNIYLPYELNRSDSIKKDLILLCGNNFMFKIKPLSSTLKYIERIIYCGNNNPDLLLSHVYTRYMGDLYGGQILKNRVKKILKLNTNDPDIINFYTFSNIYNIKYFINDYKCIINDLPVKISSIFVDEANLSFQFNIDIFNSLTDTLPVPLYNFIVILYLYASLSYFLLYFNNLLF